MSAAADPVTQEILANAFTSLAEEMAVVEYRSSFSPIIREMLDFTLGHPGRVVEGFAIDDRT